jgi:radical SAM superfamily enzyme YgiQ (UPF0313 family)
LKKVLFINAVDTSSEVETRQDNLGIGYLIASVKKHFDDDMFDFQVISNGVEKALDEYQPDLALLTSVTQNYNYAKLYAQLASNRKIPVIIGGIHISVLPDTLTNDMSIACLGEGEQTICDILEVFLKFHGNFDDNIMRGIPGLAFRNNGSLVVTQPRTLIRDLDSLPLPAREYLNISKHAYLFSSRGCPYRCVFCSSSRYWNKVRFHSAEYVVREIEHLYKTYKTQVISFYDDLFIAHRKRLAVIVEKIREQNLHKKVIFTCSARANLINEQITHLLKRMNVRSVGLGLESGNEQTLKYLKGGSVSVEDNFRCADLLVKYGINANASFVIGSPMETEAQITDTYDFIKRSKISLFDVYLLTPLPGTPIWEEAKRRNLVCEDEKMDWSILNVNFAQNWKQAIILSKTLNREQLWKIYKKFLRLRLWRNAYKIWSNPFLIRLPGYLSKHIRNRIKYLVKIEINKRLITAVNLVLKP